ncbi:MAG: 3-methyl-2-oxobutanoate dehydrogenase subunit VorB [Spirochaetes bacterium GWF1_41_5]|nr:MAG: 3-methyl-2-oxobutanoate dehydrogenase subunit VorB [Spirochaetes bacterium GWF1_41_5]
MIKNGKVLLKGNEVICQAAINAGLKFFAGYPITPQNEIPEYMSSHLPAAGGIFIQAESETAAINMIFGASAAGFRAMTSSSSPGIALKQEGISYIAAGELPCVIVNIMRGGPGLGNIRASQADYFMSVKGGGHGDYHCIVLSPASHSEAWSMVMNAFDYADYYRNPVMILGDGIFGQMMEPLEFTEYKSIKKLPSKSGWRLDGCAGREAHVIKTLHLDPPDALITHNARLQKKYSLITEELCLAEEYMCQDADIIITGYGITGRISREACSVLRASGIKAGLIRPISLWPFPAKIYAQYKGRKFLTVEMSAGQFIEDVRLSLSGDKTEFLGLGGGWYPDTEQIVEKVKNIL